MRSVVDVLLGAASAMRATSLLPVAIAGALAAGAAPLSAQAAGIEFTVSGSSTIRGWSCTVPGTAEVTTGSSSPVRGIDEGVLAATLTVQVEDFVCPEDEMRQHLLEAMRSAEFPQIIFRLDGYEATGPGAVTNGQLTILDATRPVSFPMSLSAAESGVAVEGELLLDMTAYGVEPPVVMMGLLRVRPEIRIEFEGVLGR